LLIFYTKRLDKRYNQIIQASLQGNFMFNEVQQNIINQRFTRNTVDLTLIITNSGCALH